MKNRTMSTKIGKINLAEMELMTDCIEVFVLITVVSEKLKTTVEENVQRAKAEFQKEFLDEKGLKWSNAGINLDYQSLHIIMKEKELSYELCFNFEDKENDLINTGFNLVVDLSEHTAELKKLILESLTNQFCD